MALGAGERPGAGQGCPRGPHRSTADEAARGAPGGLLESWELLPEGYRPLLDEDVFSILGEIEGAARLARRRTALRRHLDSVDRLEISSRIESLERDLSELEDDSLLACAVGERALREAR